MKSSYQEEGIVRVNQAIKMFNLEHIHSAASYLIRSMDACIYISSEKHFVIGHIKCFHDMLDMIMSVLAADVAGAKGVHNL